MATRHYLAAVAAMAMIHADVHALVPPKDSDGPVRLLSCAVDTSGVLQAEVDNQSDDAMFCDLRCNYDFGGKTLFYWFEVTIPKHFTGRLGHFDTSGGKPGRYSGDVGRCEKTDAHASAP